MKPRSRKTRAAPEATETAVDTGADASDEEANASDDEPDTAQAIENRSGPSTVP